MAWMTKRRLRDEVVRLTYRVAELEERLCPCKQHDWLRISSRLEYIGGPEPMSVYRYICRRCGKEKEELF